MPQDTVPEAEPVAPRNARLRAGALLSWEHPEQAGLRRMTTPLHRTHHYRSHWRRGLYALAFVASVVTVGTVGMHALEGLSYLDAFYFISMIATAQGPPTAPATVAGKLFAALMAYISVGSVVAALGLFFGPFFGQLWHLGATWLEEDTRR